MPVILSGWKYVAFVGTLVGAIGITMYPIFIEPVLNVDKYKQIQARNREGVIQDAIQPGNMKVWSDPFGKK
ncbi:Small integral membrane protein 20-like Protein [Gryllus bimaculatus]|nr:Small integral membrane protein 20-like Protein [Gryllus bimaculatus]